MIRTVVVDDEEHSRRMVRTLLERHLADEVSIVAEAQNTTEAREAILRHAPDVLFLDIHMPVMTGIDCLKKIKTDGRLKDIPVIMYTSDTDPRWADTQIKRYQDLGAAHFMPKASTFPEIVEMLKAFFGPDDPFT